MQIELSVGSLRGDFFFPSISLEKGKKKNKKISSSNIFGPASLYIVSGSAPLPTRRARFTFPLQTLLLWDFTRRRARPAGNRARWDSATKRHLPLGDAAGDTHADVGEQPVPPEAVLGVGSAGRIGVHQHQHIFLALQERGEHLGTAHGTAGHPWRIKHGTTPKSFRFSLFPMHARLYSCKILDNTRNKHCAS